MFNYLSLIFMFGVSSLLVYIGSAAIRISYLQGNFTFIAYLLFITGLPLIASIWAILDIISNLKELRKEKKDIPSVQSLFNKKKLNRKKNKVKRKLYKDFVKNINRKLKKKQSYIFLSGQAVSFKFILDIEEYYNQDLLNEVLIDLADLFDNKGWDYQGYDIPNFYSNESKRTVRISLKPKIKQV